MKIIINGKEVKVEFSDNFVLNKNIIPLSKKPISIFLYEDYLNTLYTTRPKLKFNPKKRHGRNDIMRVFKKNHLDKLKIAGSIISLSASRVPETYTLWQDNIKGTYVNVEKNRKDYKKLCRYNEYINSIYGPISERDNKHTRFVVEKGDVIKVMNELKKKFTIFDLDFTIEPTKEKIKEIIYTVNCYSTNSAALSLAFGTSRHGGGDAENEAVYRPIIKEELSKHFNIKRADKADYYDGYPMRVDMFTLQKKAA